MLILFCRRDLDADAKEAVRAEVKERTGEDCMILGPDFAAVRHIRMTQHDVGALADEIWETVVSRLEEAYKHQPENEGG